MSKTHLSLNIRVGSARWHKLTPAQRRALFDAKAEKIEQLILVEEALAAHAAMTSRGQSQSLAAMCTALSTQPIRLERGRR